MSDRAVRLLLLAYPHAWRARYGDELAALIAQASAEGGRRRMRLDVVRAGCRERLRATGLIGDGLTPDDRVLSGALLVLAAWMLFVVGGIGVEKASEQWQAALSPAGRGLPTAAFHVLLVAAVLGSALVVAGLALTAADGRRFLRGGGWARVRRPIVWALVLTAVAAATLVPLAVWAHSLAFAQRNGHDAGYGAAVLAWAALFVAVLCAWTVAAIVAARRIEIGRRLLLVESAVAVAVTGTMVVMTAATGVWWGAVARSAPWFFAGTPAGSTGATGSANVALPAALMLAASLLGVVGSLHALRNASRLRPSPG